MKKISFICFMKFLFRAILFLVLIIFSPSQVSSFDDLVIEEDSITTPYKPSGSSYVYFKSKKKAGGMEKIPELESLIQKNMEITDIVLVFTEDSPADIANRENDNRNRWENLISAHPELFQYNTNYKSICQKAGASNTDAMKEVQGFYVYYAKPAPPPPPPQKEMTKGDIKKGKEPEQSTFEASSSKKDKKSKKEESEPKEEKKKSKKEKSTEDVAVKVTEKPEPAPEPEPQRPVKRTPAFTTPKKAKDPKACRPPCYPDGDEGLVAFFKNQLALSKKERKKFKDLVPTVKLSLEFNGTIKKFQVMCPDKDLQGRIEQVLGQMDNWLPAVKGGVTVKSEVRFSLKYDKTSSAMLPSDFQIIPRPNPKCTKCMSDAEIFGE
jgi:hypothetical protein